MGDYEIVQGKDGNWVVNELYGEGKKLCLSNMLDSKEEAEAEKKKWEMFDVVSGRVEELVDDLASEFGVTPSEMEKIVKEVL